MTGVSRKSIADHILLLLADCQLSATDIRGQTYDGAGGMVGKEKGVAARITQLIPKAVKTNCILEAIQIKGAASKLFRMYT